MDVALWCLSGWDNEDKVTSHGWQIGLKVAILNGDIFDIFVTPTFAKYSLYMLVI